MTCFQGDLEKLIAKEIASALNSDDESALTHRLADTLDNLSHAIAVVAVALSAGDGEFCDEVVDTICEKISEQAFSILLTAHTLSNTDAQEFDA